MRSLASIQKIDSMSPIKDADRIELAHIKGWQCVVDKGMYRPGEYVVFCEIDSFLPIKEEYEFLRTSSYKNSPILGEGFLISTRKLRGEISQGLILPLNSIHLKQHQVLAEEPVYEAGYAYPQVIRYWVGKDVSKELGIRKWEEPETATTGGTTKGSASRKIKITDETRIQNIPEILEEFKGVPYYISTKIDGTSCSVSIDEDGFHVFGHHYEYKDDGKCSFYEWVKKHNVREMMEGYMQEHHLTKMVIQGEYHGPGIQKNKLFLKEPDWRFFTIDEDGKRVGLKEMDNFWHYCIEHNNYIKMVPIQEVGDDLTKTYHSVDELLKRAEMDPTHTYPGQPEGIVIRPIEPVYSEILGTDLSIKVINNKYLLKK